MKGDRNRREREAYDISERQLKQETRREGLRVREHSER